MVRRPVGSQQHPEAPHRAPTLRVSHRFFNVLELYRWYWLALAVLIILMWAVRRLENSRVGRSWLAIREDEDAAGIMGVPAFKFKLWAFAIGAALGGIAGMLFASRQAYIDPGNFQLNLSFLFVAMVVIGGSGNMMGAVVGAVLLTYLPERFREFDEWRPVRLRCCAGRGDGAASPGAGAQPKTGSRARGSQARGAGGARCLRQQRRLRPRVPAAARPCSRSTTSPSRFGGVVALDEVNFQSTRARSLG